MVSLEAGTPRLIIVASSQSFSHCGKKQDLTISDLL